MAYSPGHLSNLVEPLFLNTMSGGRLLCHRKRESAALPLAGW